MEPIISLSHLTKHFSVAKKEPGFFGSVRSLFNRKYEIAKAVDDISFSIHEGEVVGFIGPNGAGKTTTLKSLAGLLYPTKGEVSVLGFTPFERRTTFLKQISLVMGQKNQLWWDLPAMDTFLLNKEIYEVPTKTFNEIVDDLSDRLAAKEFLHIPVKKLSLGQRMKMELIASLIHSPKVLFLDEPTIGLDVMMQQTIRDFLREYNKKYNSTIMLTSHYMADVEALCKRIIIINYGKILYDGLLTDLVKQFAPFKRISVILAKDVEKAKLLQYGKMEKYTFPEWVLQVSHAKANSVAADILKELVVEDIKIEDPEIEEVIQQVFTEAKK